MKNKLLFLHTIILFGLAFTQCGKPIDQESVQAGRRIFITQSKLEIPFYSKYSETSNPDIFCNHIAHGKNLGGTWIAFLSTQTIIPIDAINLITTDGPFYDVKGELIFQNKDQFLVGPSRPLNTNEHGQTIPDDEPVWTGSKADGTKSDDVCFDQQNFLIWGNTDPLAQGRIGRIGKMDARWFSGESLPCNQTAHIICVEQ